MRLKLIALLVVAILGLTLLLVGTSPRPASAQAPESVIIVTSIGTAVNGNYSQSRGEFYRIASGTPGPTPCVPTPAVPAGVAYVGSYTLSNDESGQFALAIPEGTNDAYALGAPQEFPENPTIVEQGPATVTARVFPSSGFGSGQITLTSNGVAITGSIVFFTRISYDAIPGQTCSVPTPTPTPGASPTPANSAVTISGRVTTPAGQGIRNAVVVLTDSFGRELTATTSSFGIYSFTGLTPNETYTLSVRSRRYRFAPRTVSTQSDMSNVDFAGLE